MALNDLFANRTLLPGDRGITKCICGGSTLEPDESARTSGTVWYEWVVPGDWTDRDQVGFKLEPSLATDPGAIIDVWRAVPGHTPSASDVDIQSVDYAGFFFGETRVKNLVPGESLYVQVNSTAFSGYLSFDRASIETTGWYDDTADNSSFYVTDPSEDHSRSIATARGQADRSFGGPDPWTDNAAADCCWAHARALDPISFFWTGSCPALGAQVPPGPDGMTTSFLGTFPNTGWEVESVPRDVGGNSDVSAAATIGAFDVYTDLAFYENWPVVTTPTGPPDLVSDWTKEFEVPFDVDSVDIELTYTHSESGGAAPDTAHLIACPFDVASVGWGPGWADFGGGSPFTTDTYFGGESPVDPPGSMVIGALGGGSSVSATITGTLWRDSRTAFQGWSGDPYSGDTFGVPGSPDNNIVKVGLVSDTVMFQSSSPFYPGSAPESESAFITVDGISVRVHPTLPRYRYYAHVFDYPRVPAPQRQFPRDDGLAMSTKRSWPPPTSKQYGQRRGPVSTYW